jgi:uncharacterized protein (TIGR02679 family)
VSPDPEDELLEALRRPGLKRLWPAVRERFEHLGGARGTVRLSDATEEERSAVGGLLGLRALPPEGDLRVSLERLDRTLRESRFEVSLEEALTRLGGPLRNRPAEKESRRRDRRKMWEGVEAHPLVTEQQALQQWLDELRASGLLRRLAGSPGEEKRLLERALRVLAALPREGDGETVRLPVLASRVLGSSHALDAGEPEAALVLRALARLQGSPVPGSAGERRELWQGAGVVTDDVSSRVLALGLRPQGGGAVGEALRLFAEAGEPVQLTLRQLLVPDLWFLAGDVYVCENPVVISAAADRWGAESAPLVCLSGYPDHAGRRLLELLAEQGSELRYHGDFDWEGLRIANSVRRTVAFEPWRFTAEDYRAAVAGLGGGEGGGEGVTGRRLRGEPVVAEWDPELGTAMAEVGIAVEEEWVLGGLVGELGSSG